LSQRGLFVPLEHDIQKATKQVLAACPRLMAQHGANRNSADPFVVGLALARGGTVVTQETPANSSRKLRIPDACIAVGVPWMTLPDLVDAQGWQIRIDWVRRLEWRSSSRRDQGDICRLAGWCRRIRICLICGGSSWTFRRLSARS
jgi:hypothetical protein